MSNSVNLKVGVKGKDEKSFKMPLTLDKVSEWIRLQEFDEYTTEGLIALAGRYPTHALPMFRKNFNVMIARVRAQRRREMLEQGETPEEDNFSSIRQMGNDEFDGGNAITNITEKESEASSVEEV